MGRIVDRRLACEPGASSHTRLTKFSQFLLAVAQQKTERIRDGTLVCRTLVLPERFSHELFCSLTVDHLGIEYMSVLHDEVVDIPALSAIWI